MTTDIRYEELSHQECLELLRSHRFGRVGVIVGGRPMVFPVNYTVDGDTVAFKTDIGTKLEGAAFGHVCFEIDGLDDEQHTGWSVIVQGMGNEITDALDLHSTRMRTMDLTPWVPGDHAHWVAVSPESITGRRLTRRLG